MRLLIIPLLLIIATVGFAQEKTKSKSDFRHFDISATMLFWTPIGEHMKATNSLIILTPPQQKLAVVMGYGSGIAPELAFKFYFKKYIGISTAINYLHLTNHLEFDDPSTPVTGGINTFNNEAKIINLKFGYTGQTDNTPRLHLVYGIGINFIPWYSLQLNTENAYEFPPNSTTGSALGAYIDLGLQLRLYKNVFINWGIDFSYIPTTLKYKDESSSIYEEKTNLGGIAGQIGISYKFLSY